MQAFPFPPFTPGPRPPGLTFKEGGMATPYPSARASSCVPSLKLAHPKVPLHHWATALSTPQSFTVFDEGGG